MTTALHSIAFKAQTHPTHRFQNLYGLLDSDLLIQSWGQLNKQSAPGIDGKTFDDYRPDLMSHIDRLNGQLKHKQYRAADIKRVYIPKSNGGQRPLGLPTLDDKLVQQGVSQILQSLWEPDFQRCSYGYRPNKSAHQAVHSLMLNLQFRGYGYIVEADIKGFFDNMSYTWLMKMLAQRIDDKALLTLINQWLKARVRQPGQKAIKPTSGTPQGGVITPITIVHNRHSSLWRCAAGFVVRRRFWIYSEHHNDFFSVYLDALYKRSNDFTFGVKIHSAQGNIHFLRKLFKPVNYQK